MKNITLDSAKAIIGGACTFSYEVVDNACVQTITCNETTKFGQPVTNITKKAVSANYCNVEPAV